MTVFDYLNPKVPKDKNLSKKRLKICFDCPRLIKATTQCKECGCFMKAKTQLEYAKCPLNKW